MISTTGLSVHPSLVYSVQEEGDEDEEADCISCRLAPYICRDRRVQKRLKSSKARA